MWGVLSPSLFLSLLLALVALDLVQGEAPLDVKWGITLGEVDNSDDPFQFLLQWMTSNYIGDENVQIELLEPVNCTAPVGFTEELEEGEDGAPFWGPQNVPGLGNPQNSDGLGIRNYIQEVNINTRSIYTNPALFKYTNPSNTTASLSFCSRFSLSTGDTEVNWLETIVTIFVDLRDGFKLVDLSAVPNDRLVETKEYTNDVEASFCYGEPPQDLTPEQVGNLPAGATVQVCVRPGPNAIALGLAMRRIDRFTWIREDPITGGIAYQEAVTGGSSSNVLTELYCPSDGSSDVCYFRTLIKADFFALSLPAPPPEFTSPPAIAPLTDAPTAPTESSSGSTGGGGGFAPTTPSWSLPTVIIPQSYVMPLASGEASSDATISRTRRSLSVDEITDGLLSTSWTSSADDAQPWLQFDLNGYKVIRTIEIKWREGFCALWYRIYYSDDKVSWTLLKTASGFQAQDDRVDMFKMDRTRYEPNSCNTYYDDLDEYENALETCKLIPKYGRYVRIELGSPCSPESTFSIRELKIWGHDVQGGYRGFSIPGNSLNLVDAEGSSVWVEGYSDATNAIDGTRETFFRSAGPSSDGEYLTVELEDYFELTEIQIDWYGTNIPNTLRIQTSREGTIFTGGGSSDYPVAGYSNAVTTITKDDLDDMYLDNMVKYVRIYGQSGSKPMGIRDLRVKGFLPLPLRENIAIADAPPEITDSNPQTGFLIDTAIATNIYGLVIPLPFWYTIVSFDAVVGYDSSFGIKYSVDGGNFFSAGYLQETPSGSNTIYRMDYDEEAKYVRLECYGSPCTVKDISIMGYKTIPQPTELSLTPIQVTSNAENAALAVDGDATTSWVSDPTDQKPTFVVDLGNRGYLLRHFTIKFRDDRYPTRFFVERSIDNSNWDYSGQQYYSPTDTAVSPTWHQSFGGPSDCRYVRIRVENKTSVDAIEIEDFSIEGLAAPYEPVYMPRGLEVSNSSHDWAASRLNYSYTPDFSYWQPWVTGLEEPAWYSFKFLDKGYYYQWNGAYRERIDYRRWHPRVITLFSMQSEPGFEPVDFALEVSTDKIDEFGYGAVGATENLTWTRVITATNATADTTRGTIRTFETSEPVWANLWRIVILKHGPANRTEISRMWLYGYDGRSNNFYAGRRLEEEEDSDPDVIPYDEDRRLLGQEEDADPYAIPLGGSRNLQPAPIVIGGVGAATLRYPGRRQAALRAEAEKQRHLQDAEVIPEALLEEGAEFNLEFGLVPMAPRDFSSGYHASARLGTISLGATMASAFVAMAMWLV